MSSVFLFSSLFCFVFFFRFIYWFIDFIIFARLTSSINTHSWKTDTPHTYQSATGFVTKTRWKSKREWEQTSHGETRDVLFFFCFFSQRVFVLVIFPSVPVLGKLRKRGNAESSTSFVKSCWIVQQRAFKKGMSRHRRTSIHLGFLSRWELFALSTWSWLISHVWCHAHFSDRRLCVHAWERWRLWFLLSLSCSLSARVSFPFCLRKWSWSCSISCFRRTEEEFVPPPPRWSSEVCLWRHVQVLSRPCGDLYWSKSSLRQRPYYCWITWVIRFSLHWTAAKKNINK